MCITDGEATNNRAADSMKYDWGTCNDHIIELVTGIAFNHSDFKEVLKKARKVAAHFHASNLETEKLNDMQRVFNRDAEPQARKGFPYHFIKMDLLPYMI